MAYQQILVENFGARVYIEHRGPTLPPQHKFSPHQTIYIYKELGGSTLIQNILSSSHTIYRPRWREIRNLIIGKLFKKNKLSKDQGGCDDPEGRNMNGSVYGLIFLSLLFKILNRISYKVVIRYAFSHLSGCPVGSRLDVLIGTHH